MDNKQFPEDLYPPEQGEDSALFPEDSLLPLDGESLDDGEAEQETPLSDEE